MKLVITGGCGFIGSHVAERLLEGKNEITVIDNLSTGRIENISHIRKDIKFFEADVCDTEAVAACCKGAEAVIHIAALADIVPSIVNPRAYYRANVDGTMSVAEAARAARVSKIVYAASSSCYGIPGEGHYPTGESAPAKPQYPYALTKHLGEQIILHWGSVYGMRAISLRLFNVYGPRSRTSGAYGAVLGVFLAQKLNGRPFTIVGDGEQKRDFIYVTDAASAFEKALFSDVGNEIFNVGAGSPRSINELAGILGGEKVFIPRRPGEPDCTWACIEKIKSMTGWQPEVTLEAGVSLVMKNIDYWKDAPLWTPGKISDATRDWFKYLGKEENGKANRQEG